MGTRIILLNSKREHFVAIEDFLEHKDPSRDIQYAHNLEEALALVPEGAVKCIVVTDALIANSIEPPVEIHEVLKILVEKCKAKNSKCYVIAHSMKLDDDLSGPDFYFESNKKGSFQALIKKLEELI
ncbi:MAG: hypothetical protein KA007_03135 [Candidatus Pacebacteria bacterium]|nr:hypothetical protein [Candidatus Paceibacterota bacterium]